MDGTAAADTIVALSSGRPPAAIAIVRTSGPSARAAAERLTGPLPGQRRAALRRLVDPRDGALIDEALVLRFDAPRSATGEDIVEYQCHGGRASVDALVAALLDQPGFRLAEPGEFTRRALANGRIDLTEAEGLADLLAAETELQRRSAMARAGGALRARLDDWRDRLLALSAKAEVAIDYADEDDGAAADLTADMGYLAAEMAELLAAPRVEPLREGIRVAVAGPPNAGKSSLVNALAQSERAIVTPIAGTTRDVIEVPLAIGGVPFVLVDTAGLRESDDMVEAIGIDRARREAERAELLLWLGPGGQAPGHDGLIRIASKADLGMPEDQDALPVSAVTGEGLLRLTELLIERARNLLPKGDELALDRRQHDLLAEAQVALSRAVDLSDPVLVAEELRTARLAIDRIAGRAGVEELLDALFGRFCLGK
jgi:tRNA modification GTPase